MHFKGKLKGSKIFTIKDMDWNEFLDKLNFLFLSIFHILKWLHWKFKHVILLIISNTLLKYCNFTYVKFIDLIDFSYIKFFFSLARIYINCEECCNMTCFVLVWFILAEILVNIIIALSDLPSYVIIKKNYIRQTLRNDNCAIVPSCTFKFTCHLSLFV